MTCSTKRMYGAKTYTYLSPNVDWIGKRTRSKGARGHKHDQPLFPSTVRTQPQKPQSEKTKKTTVGWGRRAWTSPCLRKGDTRDPPFLVIMLLLKPLWRRLLVNGAPLSGRYSKIHLPSSGRMKGLTEHGSLTRLQLQAECWYEQEELPQA